jgi:hypothetical protein
MGPVVVAILDRDDWDANTDVIVHVDARRKRLTWIPRDLWSPQLGDRINAAFAKGGCRGLERSLQGLGFACTGVLCLRRGLTEAVLGGVTVTVPVKGQLDFWYPLDPTRPIEEGRKQISFKPPREVLSGERLHQWIGARYVVVGAGSDLHRIGRQQALVKALLEQGFDFSAVLADSQRFRLTGNPLPPLRAIRAGWTMTTYDKLDNAIVDGKQVLVPVDPLPPILVLPLWRRALGRLGRMIRRFARGPTKDPRQPTSARRSSHPP